MKKALFLVISCLYGCGVFKTKEKELFKYDSSKVRHLEMHFAYDSIAEKTDSLYLINREQQWLEIFADAPYRWHPDSGLSGNAGHIRLLLSKEGEFQQTHTLLEKQKLGIQENSMEDTKIEKFYTRLNKEKSVSASINHWSWMLFVIMGGMFVMYKLWKIRL